MIANGRVGNHSFGSDSRAAVDERVDDASIGFNGFERMNHLIIAAVAAAIQLVLQLLVCDFSATHCGHDCSYGGLAAWDS